MKECQRADQICTVLENKKARNILQIDVSGMTVVADSFIICSGRSALQVKALCDEVERLMEEQGVFARRKDGYAAGRWIVMDYEDVLLHIFHEEERSFYNLERLWMKDDNYRYWQDEQETL